MGQVLYRLCPCPRRRAFTLIDRSNMTHVATDSTADPTEAPQTALKHLPAHGRFWLVAAGFLCLDLWTKHWVFATLAPNETRSMMSRVIEFRRSLNDGAVFGSFTGQTGLFIFASIFALGFVFYLFAHSPRSSRILHIALGLILAGALGNLYDRATVEADVVSFHDSSGRARSMIGKIVDQDDSRLLIGDWPDGSNPRQFRVEDVTQRKQGVVRDFIKFMPKFPQWFPKLAGRDMWPWVFNVADSALVCGVIILLLTSWTDRRHERA